MNDVTPAFVTAVVLAAGSSRRLGQPKQVLPYAGSTLLDAALDVARRARVDEVIVTLGASATAVRAAVDLRNVHVVESQQHQEGCSASIVAAIDAVDPRAHGIVLLLGDQPGVRTKAVQAVIAAGLAAGADRPIAAARYEDGRGHPFWFARSVFDELRGLHGDKAIWKLLESGRFPVADVDLPGLVPLDVDTWADYERLVASDR